MKKISLNNLLHHPPPPPLVPPPPPPPPLVHHHPPPPSLRLQQPLSLLHPPTTWRLPRRLVPCPSFLFYFTFLFQYFWLCLYDSFVVFLSDGRLFWLVYLYDPWPKNSLKNFLSDSWSIKVTLMSRIILTLFPKSIFFPYLWCIPNWINEKNKKKKKKKKKKNLNNYFEWFKGLLRLLLCLWIIMVLFRTFILKKFFLLIFDVYRAAQLTPWSKKVVLKIFLSDSWSIKVTLMPRDHIGLVSKHFFWHKNLSVF